VMYSPMVTFTSKTFFDTAGEILSRTFRIG